MMSETVVKPPSVRELNVGRTKRAILKAAEAIFASHGYAEAGVRDIAARARVNPALIARYFGSKLKLFEDVLEASLDVSVFTSIDREHFGERLAEMFWSTKANAARSVPMLVFAAGDSQARASALKILKNKVVQPLEEWFGVEDAADRAAQLISVVTGFYTYRLMLPLPPFVGEPTAAMRRWLARTLQSIVDL